jgi:hypothetical protein
MQRAAKVGLRGRWKRTDKETETLKLRERET